MEKQISIIIPTYNMEAYIGKCLDSLLIPEFGQVEVWVVNDGSKDRSSEIAHSYANRYPDSIHVLDKPNGNYGSCINAALPLCTGRYIKILDADDTFNTTAFSQFVNMLCECEEDVVVTSYVQVNEKGETDVIHELSDWGVEFDKRYTIEEAGELFLDRYIGMHRIAYKADVFKRFDYRQTEGISYTDTEWAIVPLAYTQSIKALDIKLYRYLRGREGQTMSADQLSKNLKSLFVVLESLVCNYVSFKGQSIQNSLLENEIKNRHVYTYLIAIGSANNEAMSALKHYDKALKENSPELYRLIGEHSYSSQFKYNIFDKIRQSGYPSNFKIPVYIKFLLYIYSKMYAVRSRICPKR